MLNVKLALSLAILLGLLFIPFRALSVENSQTRFASNSKSPEVLVMYFHGLGSDCSEPFVAPSVKDSVAVRILGALDNVAIRCATSDATTVLTGKDNYESVTGIIQKTMKDNPSINQVVLCGSSLGGYEALAYLHYAPKDVLDQITGVISVEPADDLFELYELTASDPVRAVLRQAFDGEPRTKFSTYQDHSLPVLLSTVHRKAPLKVCVVSATQDRVVPPFQQRRLVRTLREMKFDAQLLEINSQHGVRNSVIFSEAIQAVQRPSKT
jgi:pimeloyl-ACP methyl ester carboxylesterase